MDLKQRELSMVSRLSINELDSAKICKIGHNLINFEQNQANSPKNNNEIEDDSDGPDADLPEESSTSVFTVAMVKQLKDKKIQMKDAMKVFAKWLDKNK
jgi:hypothetical protein